MYFPPFHVWAQAAPPVDPVLAKAREATEQFFDRFAYLRYQEDITQQKLKNESKIDYKRDTVYDSIWRVHFEDGKLRVDEQRLIEKLPVHVDSRPLLITNGFSSLAVIFHPFYESSFHFARLEDDARDGKTLARYQFTHIPGTPSPILYQMVASERPLSLTGTAWLDPLTGDIYKIEIEAGAGMADVGIKAIRAQLIFGPVPLRDELEKQWLPVSSTVDLQTPKQHWRNIHRFSDYRKYRVDVKIEGAEKQQ